LNQNELYVFWNGIEVGLALLRDFFKVFYYTWDGEVTGGGVIHWIGYPLSYLSFQVVVLSFICVLLILGELLFDKSYGLGLGLDCIFILDSNSYCKFIVTIRWVCSPSGCFFSHAEDVNLVVSTRLFWVSCYENSTICYNILLPVSGFDISSGIFQINTLDINNRNRSVGRCELVFFILYSIHSLFSFIINLP
jgi:hypothetical protein